VNPPDERFPALVRDGIVLARGTQALIHECFVPEHHDPEMGQMGSQLLSDYDQLRCRGQRLVEAGESPGGVQLLEGASRPKARCSAWPWSSGWGSRASRWAV
jgi:hypothetical protein